jgi:DNA-binding LacI/PurR family transcriptional regulator
MRITTDSDAGIKTGRESARLIAAIKGSLDSGAFGVGQFLPSERSLAAEHGLAQGTVRRALRQLESQGLVATVPRRGYRVVARPARGETTGPVAYLLHNPNSPGDWETFHNRLLTMLRGASDVRGRSFFAASSHSRPHGEVVAELKSVGACGVLLDIADRGLVAAVREAGIPAVIIDAWIEDSGLDAVVQDGHLGGLLAARHLVARGHKRVAWFGPLDGNMHTLDRLGGALAGLAQAGIVMRPEDLVGAGFDDNLGPARRLLSRRDRPPAIICLWQEFVEGLKAAADELGLKIGKDFEVVSWSPEELYESSYCRAFAGGAVPPAVTWRVADMVATALDRLAERARNPNLPALRLKVPTRLRLAT